MTKPARIMQYFFATLPGFTLWNTLFNMVLILNLRTNEYIPVTSLFFFLFLALLIVKESVRNAPLSFSLQAALALGAAVLVMYWAPNDSVRNTLLVYAFALAVNSLRPRSESPGGPSIYIAIIINALLVIAFSMADTPVTESGFMYWVKDNVYQRLAGTYYVFLAQVILCLISRYMYSYYNALSILAASRRMKRQSGGVARRIMRRSSALVSGFTLLVLVVISPVFIQTIPKNIYIALREPTPEPIKTAPPIRDLVLEPVNINVTPEPMGIEGVAAIKQSDVHGDVETSYEDNSGALTVAAVAVVIISVIIFAMFYKKPRIDSFENAEYPENIGEWDSYTQRGHRRDKGAANTNMAVRAMLVKKVNEYQKRGLKVNKSATAHRLTGKIGEQEDIELLDSLYHIARYSPDVVSKSELARLKAQERGQKHK